MREKILKLFEVSKTTKSYLNFVDMMCKAMADQINDAVLAARATERIMSVVEAEMPLLNEKFVQLYADTYTEEEIDAMIAYYTSPVGKKVIAVSSQLTADAAQISNSILGAKISEALATLI